MKQNQTHILFLLLALCCINANAQNPYPWLPLHYQTTTPLGASPVVFDGTNFTLSLGSDLYTDDDRARVITIRPTTFSRKKLLLSTNSAERLGLFSNTTGVNTMKNNHARVIIMQMKLHAADINGHWNTGQWYEGIIDDYAVNGAGQIEVTIGTDANWIQPQLDTLSGSVIQVIRVPIYRDFTLDGGMVTCHPYDGSTGGVLAMRIYSLHSKSGMFNAAAKGYFPENVSWGSAGTGANGDNTYSSSATTTKNNQNGTICPDNSGLNLFLGNYGKVGDPKVTPGGSGTTTSGTAIFYGYPHRTGVNYPMMGSAGYFKTGQKGGNGAEGGGHGGTGGASLNGNPGASGVAGGSGGTGGTVGQGAIGGGIIMLKMYQVTWPTGNVFSKSDNNYLFYINGQNGGYGGNGGRGGEGGNGGAGGLGSSIGPNIYFAGGAGEPGEPGNGAQGGGGSNGANPGTCYLFTNGVFSPPGGFSNAWEAAKALTNRKPGKAGYGGQGGAKGKVFYDEENPNFTLPGGKTWCSAGGGGPDTVHICDCDSVFWAMSSGKATGVNQVSNTTHYDFNSVSAYPHLYDVYVKKETDEYHLWSWHKTGGNTIIVSHCHLFSDTQCMPMMEKIRGAEKLPSGWGDIDLALAAANRASTSPLIVNFTRKVSPYLTAIQWQGNNQVLQDIMEPGQPICYKGTCDPDAPKSRTRGSDGAKHNDGDTAFIDESDDESHIGLMDSWNLPPPQQLESDNGLTESVTGYVADKVFQLLPKNQPDKVEYMIINSIGQTIVTGITTAEQKWQIPLQGISPGIYTVTLQGKNAGNSIKFVIIE